MGGGAGDHSTGSCRGSQHRLLHPQSHITHWTPSQHRPGRAERLANPITTASPTWASLIICKCLRIIKAAQVSTSLLLSEENIICYYASQFTSAVKFSAFSSLGCYVPPVAGFAEIRQRLRGWAVRELSNGGSRAATIWRTTKTTENFHKSCCTARFLLLTTTKSSEFLFVKTNRGEFGLEQV